LRQANAVVHVHNVHYASLRSNNNNNLIDNSSP
jgi:hypothetical protein